MKLIIVCITLISILSTASSKVECETYNRIYGLLDLKTKSFKLIKINPSLERFCNQLVLPEDANIEISLSNKDKKYTTKIFHSLVTFWDHSAPDGQWSGGLKQQNDLHIQFLAPIWSKGASLTIKDIQKNKFLIKGKI